MILSAAFAQRAPGAASPSDVGGIADLEQRLAALHEVGRRAWPAVPLPPEALAAHLGRHAPASGDGGEALRAYLDSVAAADLYLACACGRGEPAALGAFERAYLAELPSLLAGIALSPPQQDELRARLRDKLLFPPPGAEPKIATYSGRGALKAWLRVAARRAAMTLLGERPQEVAAEPALEAAASEPPPELRYLRDRYRDELGRALREAFGTLSAQQRNALRLHFLEGLTDEKIGALLKVHRTTVTRWIDAAREQLLGETRRRLCERLQLRPAEAESLAGALRSQLDLSLTGLLRAPGPAPEEGG